MKDTMSEGWVMIIPDTDKNNGGIILPRPPFVYQKEDILTEEVDTLSSKEAQDIIKRRLFADLELNGISLIVDDIIWKCEKENFAANKKVVLRLSVNTLYRLLSDAYIREKRIYDVLSVTKVVCWELARYNQGISRVYEEYFYKMSAHSKADYLKHKEAMEKYTGMKSFVESIRLKITKNEFDKAFEELKGYYALI